LAGLAAADDDHLSLLQTSAVARHQAPAECKAARAKSRASKAAMKEARAALKAARAAFKEAKATYKTDKAAVPDACPEKDTKDKPLKVKPGKPCATKGYKEAPGYVDGPGRKVVIISGAERHRIGTYVFRGEWLQKTEGERLAEYHKEMCESFYPQYQAIIGNTSIATPGDTTCERDKSLRYNNCDPRGRVCLGAPEGTKGCEVITTTADNNQYKAYNPSGNYAVCMDPICAKICSDDPNCKSYEARPGHGHCEIHSGTANRMPYYGKYTGNYLVVQDGIYCEKE